ncbi:hypothetical protein [Peribacillus sp. AS_2]|uniref:hypothetical protein n=1 Tax=Peribacillus sp. AS_2 TaxID=2996755 RepID=UPI0022A74009|nr:hypothetical protein [Peribacillus sp. AS_2]MCZ0875628.1 hypothetical protein [Peribacillus sp. AS_2]
MKKWIEKQEWWMAPGGILVTILIGFYPKVFADIGTTLNKLSFNQWLLIFIIILLLSILKLLLKQQNQKNDPSA